MESVYSKLNMVNHFVESDADILAILNGSADADLSLVGSGTNNEDALNEISLSLIHIWDKLFDALSSPDISNEDFKQSISSEHLYPLFGIARQANPRGRPRKVKDGDDA